MHTLERVVSSTSSYYARARNRAMPVRAWRGLACAVLSLGALSIRARAQATYNTPGTERTPALILSQLYQPAGDRDALVKELLSKGVGIVPVLLDDSIARPRHERFNTRLLGQLGPKAAAALLDQTEMPDRAPAAARALSSVITPAAGVPVARVIGCVKRAETKHDCGVALVRAVGARSAAAVPALSDLLKSSDRDERLYAAMALKQVGTGNPAVAEALRRAAGDSDDEVKDVARRALGLKPQAARKAVLPAPAAAARAKAAAPAARGTAAPQRSVP